MSRCSGCVCAAPPPVETATRLLLCTRVDHTVAALRGTVRRLGGTTRVRAPGLLEVEYDDLDALVTAARGELSSVEADEVRALRLTAAASDADLLAQAMTAPTLAMLDARVTHADLLPLFADERACFYSLYQPIVDLADGRVLGHEALLRAAGPDGEIGPADLFGAAEQAGWTHLLDRVGRTTALHDAAGWLGDDLLFINFIPTSIYRPQVCLRTTERAAVEAGLRLDQLVFEVTEGARVTDVAHLAGVFAYYRERGCKVALDDLGAGYSSLNLLVALQPDVVKLDKALVQSLPEVSSTTVVAAVVEIAHSYGGKVLAECVETAEQAGAAAALGVDYGQGWFFGRPVRRQPADAVAEAAHVTRLPVQRVPADPTLPDPAVAVAEADPAVAVARRATPDPLGPPELPHGLLVDAVVASASGVSIADVRRPDMPLVYVNPAFERLTGYPADEMLGRNCRLLQGPDTDPEVAASIGAAIRAGHEYTAVLLNYTRAGDPWWNELHMSPVRDDVGRVTHYIGFQHDVTDRVAAQRQVAHLAYHDQLTGLPNRVRVTEQLELELHRARRSGSAVAVLFVDLDGFKQVNDTLGHAAGDAVLAEVAGRLRVALRTGDLLGRHGGDEFVAVIPDLAPERAQAVAERAASDLAAAVRRPIEAAGRPLTLGASVGLAVFPRSGGDAEQLLGAADAAMYAVKAALQAAQGGQTAGTRSGATGSDSPAGPVGRFDATQM